MGYSRHTRDAACEVILTEPDIPNPEGRGLTPQGTPPPIAQSGYQPNPDDILKQRHAETANRLVAWLVGILAGSIILQYGCLMVLIFFRHDDAIKILDDTFHAWLPALSGFVGAAVAYYFAKNGK